MLGGAVSSSTPNDFQPNSHMGVEARPVMNRQADTGPPMGYVAVGMQRALDSAIGLPSMSTSAFWMLAFLMPADVRRSFIMPFLAWGARSMPGGHRGLRRDYPARRSPRPRREPGSPGPCPRKRPPAGRGERPRLPKPRRQRRGT